MLVIKDKSKSNKGKEFRPYTASRRMIQLVKERYNNPNLDITFLKDIKLQRLYVLVSGLDIEGISEIRQLIPFNKIVG